jgi:hypothetical protein
MRTYMCWPVAFAFSGLNLPMREMKDKKTSPVARIKKLGILVPLTSNKVGIIKVHC